MHCPLVNINGEETGTEGKNKMALSLLVVRLIIGLAMAAHGAQKAFGWFGGYGLKGTGGFFESLGYRPGVLFAALAAGGEIAGGLLTAAGLLGPVGPALIILVMIVAAGTVHFKNGFFAQSQGYEINALYIAAALALAFAGPGALSLDAALGLRHDLTDAVNGIVVAAGIVFGFLTLALRRQPAPATADA
jgi:putative oxidoreductase